MDTLEASPISGTEGAANPFFSFPVLATESGTIAFKWTGDNGFSQAEAREIVVE